MTAQPHLLRNQKLCGRGVAEHVGKTPAVVGERFGLADAPVVFQIGAHHFHDRREARGEQTLPARRRSRNRRIWFRTLPNRFKSGVRVAAIVRCTRCNLSHNTCFAARRVCGGGSRQVFVQNDRQLPFGRRRAGICPVGAFSVPRGPAMARKPTILHTPQLSNSARSEKCGVICVFLPTPMANPHFSAPEDGFSNLDCAQPGRAGFPARPSLQNSIIWAGWKARPPTVRNPG